jgi:hypothetical protein
MQGKRLFYRKEEQNLFHYFYIVELLNNDTCGNPALAWTSMEHLLSILKLSLVMLSFLMLDECSLPQFKDWPDWPDWT